MNLLIALTIVMILVIGDITSTNAPVSLWNLLGVIGFTSLIPLLAWLQTKYLRRTLAPSLPQEAWIRKITRVQWSHSAAWLILNLGNIALFRWQDLVTENWHVWPVWNHLLVLLPAIVSLIASWYFFFDAQLLLLGESEARRGDRRKFIMIRVRVYLLIILLPLIVVLATMALSERIFHAELSQYSSFLLIGFPVMLALFPFLMLLVWDTDSITDHELVDELNAICRENRLRVSGLRVWNTGRQIINAAVAGVFPYFRIILLSDGLIKGFDRAQLSVILRHEAGHIRRWHVASRILFISLPLIIYTIFYYCELDLLASLRHSISYLFPDYMFMPTLFVAYCGYLMVALSWLSHQMEYDADLYAISIDADARRQLCDQSAETMMQALLQFATLAPSQVDKKSFWHPSLRNRLIRIEQIRQNPKLVSRYFENFYFIQFLLAAGICLSVSLYVMVCILTGSNV